MPSYFNMKIKQKVEIFNWIYDTQHYMHISIEILNHNTIQNNIQIKYVFEIKYEKRGCIRDY